MENSWLRNLHSAVCLEVHERVDDMSDVRRNQVLGLKVAAIDTPLIAHS